MNEVTAGGCEIDRRIDRHYVWNVEGADGVAIVIQRAAERWAQTDNVGARGGEIGLELDLDLSVRPLELGERALEHGWAEALLGERVLLDPFDRKPSDPLEGLGNFVTGTAVGARRSKALATR